MATTTQHINARNDPDLLDRFIAAAEQDHIENASAWVQANMGQLVTADVSDTQTIADVHAHADEAREAYIAATPPRPGANLGAVSDAQLTAAIASLRSVPADTEQAS